jgi:hypothetical protein
VSFIRPIWVYGEVDVEKIKAAKAELDLPYRIKPHEATVGGGTIRVLAWGTHPPFLCDYLLVTDSTDLDDLMDAVAWALHEREDPNAMTIRDVLAGVFGPGVREVTPEELEGERRYAAFQAGTD